MALDSGLRRSIASLLVVPFAFAAAGAEPPSVLEYSREQKMRDAVYAQYFGDSEDGYEPQIDWLMTGVLQMWNTRVYQVPNSGQRRDGKYSLRFHETERRRYAAYRLDDARVYRLCGGEEPSVFNDLASNYPDISNENRAQARARAYMYLGDPCRYGIISTPIEFWIMAENELFCEAPQHKRLLRDYYRRWVPALESTPLLGEVIAEEDGYIVTLLVVREEVRSGWDYRSGRDDRSLIAEVAQTRVKRTGVVELVATHPVVTLTRAPAGTTVSIDRNWRDGLARSSTTKRSE
jgi:hypothetical protein